MKSIVIFCLLFFIGFSASFLIITFQSYRSYTNQIESDIAVLQEQVASNFIGSSQDVKKATELPELAQVIQSNNASNRQNLAEAFEVLMEKNRSYAQLRFINSMGDEVVRVNQNKKGITIVPQNQLQNKADRYYFTDTMKLNRGEYYISPLDLNIEGSQVVEPYEPTLRLATPIFDALGKKVGIMILNFDTTNVLFEIERKDDQNPSYKIYFANSDGEWFRGPTPEDDWSFMFSGEENRRVKNQFPQLWSKILTTESGSAFTPEGYFYFGKVKPIELVQQNESIKKSFTYFSRYLEVRDYYMIVIVHMQKTLYSQLLLKEVVGVNIFYFLLAGGGLGLAGVILAKRSAK